MSLTRQSRVAALNTESIENHQRQKTRNVCPDGVEEG
jgi:hypothetical protein